MSKSIIIAFSVDQAANLRAQSYIQNRSTSAIVREAVNDYFRKIKREQSKSFPSAKNIEFAGQEVGPLSSKACQEQGPT